MTSSDKPTLEELAAEGRKAWNGLMYAIMTRGRPMLIHSMNRKWLECNERIRAGDYRQ